MVLLIIPSPLILMFKLNPPRGGFIFLLRNGGDPSPSLEKKPSHSGISIQEPRDVPAPSITPSPAALGSKYKGKFVLASVDHKQSPILPTEGAAQAGPRSPSLGPALKAAAPPLCWPPLWYLRLLPHCL